MNAGFMQKAARWAVLGSLVFVTALVTGCATTRSTGDGATSTTSSDDPIEGFNRAVFTVNDKLDRAVFKPIAQGYEKVFPDPVRSCVSNIFGNIADVPASLNNFLQGKFKEGSSDICRVGVNTTIGVVGCFDIASKWGFEKHNEDFGQTLGAWGVPSGPYLVVPLFGPSTFRDAPASIVDGYMDPTHYLSRVAIRNILYGVRLVDKRAQALDTTNFIDNAALDPYVFVRDAYLTRRRSLVNDGREPASSSTDTRGGEASLPANGGPPTAK
jgi:phospholipid-binding lipoprotein MlaA